MTRKSEHDDIPLLDDIVEHDIADQTRPQQMGDSPPPNLDLFESALIDQNALRAEVAGRVNAWLAEALPDAMDDIKSELLQLLEQRLAVELPALIEQSLHAVQNTGDTNNNTDNT